MATKKYKPTSPGRRELISIDYRKTLSASEPHKSLTYGRKRAFGRNADGRITTRHKGGGHKRLYREIEFSYDKKNIPARVETIEYDPNRSGFIGLVVYADGTRRYVLLPGGVKVGDQFVASVEADAKPGNRLPLYKIPVGTFIYNIEVQPAGGARLVRSAGSFAQILGNDAGYSTVKMPSTEVRKINEKSWATVGAVSNDEHKLVSRGKAGRSRWLGIRPTVRGSAMNPVDHPHGGGEGRQPIGLRRGPKTPTGKLAFGVKTRRPKKYSRGVVLSRRKKIDRRR